MELTPTTRTKITALVARIRPGEPGTGGRLRKASSPHRLPGRIATLPAKASRVKSQQPGCPIDTNGQASGAPGAKQTAADESLRCAAPTRGEETPAPEL